MIIKILRGNWIFSIGIFQHTKSICFHLTCSAELCENNLKTWLEVTSFLWASSWQNHCSALNRKTPPNKSISSHPHRCFIFLETLLLKSMAKEKCARKFNIYFFAVKQLQCKKFINRGGKHGASEWRKILKYFILIEKKGENGKIQFKVFRVKTKYFFPRISSVRFRGERKSAMEKFNMLVGKQKRETLQDGNMLNIACRLGVAAP